MLSNRRGRLFGEVVGEAKQRIDFDNMILENALFATTQVDRKVQKGIDERSNLGKEERYRALFAALSTALGIMFFVARDLSNNDTGCCYRGRKPMSSSEFILGLTLLTAVIWAAYALLYTSIRANMAIKKPLSTYLTDDELQSLALSLNKVTKGVVLDREMTTSLFFRDTYWKRIKKSLKDRLDRNRNLGDSFELLTRLDSQFNELNTGENSENNNRKTRYSHR